MIALQNNIYTVDERISIPKTIRESVDQSMKRWRLKLYKHNKLTHALKILNHSENRRLDKMLLADQTIHYAFTTCRNSESPLHKCVQFDRRICMKLINQGLLHIWSQTDKKHLTSLCWLRHGYFNNNSLTPLNNVCKKQHLQWRQREGDTDIYIKFQTLLFANMFSSVSSF